MEGMSSQVLPTYIVRYQLKIHFEDRVAIVVGKSLSRLNISYSTHDQLIQIEKEAVQH